MPKVGGTFKIGEICPTSGVYRIKHHEHISMKQHEIPLAKGEKFPPCKNCTKEVLWELVRNA